MRAARVALGMKATARGTGKGSERGFERPVFSVRPAGAETLTSGAVLRKRVTVVAKAAARPAVAGIEVLLARRGG